MGSIALKGVKFHSDHGFYPEEKHLKGNFSVDIEVGYPTEQVDNDTLEDTVNYEDIHHIIMERMKIHAKLIETLAEEIGKKVLKLNKNISYVEVTIHKHNPPLHGEVAESVVTSRFTR